MGAIHIWVGNVGLSRSSALGSCASPAGGRGHTNYPVNNRYHKGKVWAGVQARNKVQVTPVCDGGSAPQSRQAWGVRSV